MITSPSVKRPALLETRQSLGEFCRKDHGVSDFVIRKRLVLGRFLAEALRRGARKLL